eukprot:6467674-Amphidinium_carterae.1
MHSFRHGKPHPPRNVGDVLTWPQRYHAVLPEAEKKALKAVFQDKPLWVSTAYSGIGGWETALAQIAYCCGNSLSMRVFSVCDVDPSCRQMLKAHSYRALGCMSLG